MRDQVMADLVDRVVSDEAFRARARQDLDEALSDAGFDLEPDELAAVRQFQGDMTGVSDEELVTGLRRQGG